MDKEQKLEKLAEKIKDINVAMLTTVQHDGSLRSRPMATRNMENGEEALWFFTKKATGKTLEIRNEEHVNVAYANSEKEIYVSVSGQAELVNDQAKIKQLWTPMLKTWFQEGPEDAKVQLIKVRISGAEYWDAPSNQMVKLWEIARAAVKNKDYEPAEHERI